MAKMKKKPETDAPAPHGGEKFQRPENPRTGKIYYWITVRRRADGKVVHVPIRTPPKGKGGRRLAAKYNARKRAETTGGTGAGRQREAGKLRSMRESAAEYRKNAGGLAAAGKMRGKTHDSGMPKDRPQPTPDQLVKRTMQAARREGLAVGGMGYESQGGSRYIKIGRDIGGGIVEPNFTVRVANHGGRTGADTVPLTAYVQDRQSLARGLKDVRNRARLAANHPTASPMEIAKSAAAGLKPTTVRMLNRKTSAGGPLRKTKSDKSKAARKEAAANLRAARSTPTPAKPASTPGALSSRIKGAQERFQTGQVRGALDRMGQGKGSGSGPRKLDEAMAKLPAKRQTGIVAAVTGTKPKSARAGREELRRKAEFTANAGTRISGIDEIGSKAPAAPKAGNPESAKRARLDRLGARSDLDREHLAVTRQGFADDIGRLHRINSRNPSKNVRGAIQKLRSEARAYEAHAVGRGTLEFRREGNGTAIYKPTATPSPAATAAPAPAAATPAPAAAKVASRGTPKRKEDAMALREAKRRRDAGLATKDPDRISAAHIGYSYARKTYGTGTPNRLKQARLYRKEQERRANRTVPTIDPNYKSPQQQVLERQAEKLNKTMAARAARRK
jgi:hypothetical protein